MLRVGIACIGLVARHVVANPGAEQVLLCDQKLEVPDLGDPSREMAA